MFKQNTLRVKTLKIFFNMEGMASLLFAWRCRWKYYFLFFIVDSRIETFSMIMNLDLQVNELINQHETVGNGVNYR